MSKREAVYSPPLYEKLHAGKEKNNRKGKKERKKENGEGKKAMVYKEDSPPQREKRDRRHRFF